MDFIEFKRSIHPGSIGIYSWSGRFPWFDDPGHAILGAVEGVFIGTSDIDSSYGIYLTSAAEAYQNSLYLLQLNIYEVDGIEDFERMKAADFALRQYGNGYSLFGMVNPFKKVTEDTKWYCSELTIASLDSAGVTFYARDDVLTLLKKGQFVTSAI